MQIKLMRYHLTTVRMTVIKSLQTSTDEDVKKGELSCTARRNVNWYSHYEKRMVAPQKTKKRTPISSVQFSRSVVSDPILPH